MQLRALAERVLFGDTLADKLVAADTLEDDRPGTPIATPAAPGRPAGLRLDDPRGRAPFPRDLDDPAARGRVLHFFANHELLAMELMALVLLRFPEAPAGFRLGLARTLAEEQDHMRLYMARMAELGVALGEIPVNRFFWDCVSGMEAPRDFAARMSLTFEQANLDYCLHFAGRLRQLGDARTADILDKVYADEVGHVAHGLRWFQRWTPGQDLWAAWTACLAFPLTPDRARGLGFSVEARDAAGLPRDYTRRLRVYRFSKGRPPVVWWMTPGAEDELAGQADARAARLAQADLALLPVTLAGRDDVLIVPERPPIERLEALAGAGFALTQLVEGVEALADRPLSGLQPWAWTPKVDAALAPLRDQVQGTPPGWQDPWRDLFDKRQAAGLRARLLRDLGIPWLIDPDETGVIATSISEILGLIEATEGPVVAKAPFSTAGRGLLRLDGPPTDAQRARLARWIDDQGGVVVERWWTRLADVSLHLDVGPEGPRIRGWTVFETTEGGRYRGTVVAPVARALPPALRRFWHGEGQDARWTRRVARAVAEAVNALCVARGYAGPVGVDGLVAQTDRGPRLLPLLELNPRWTMGRVGLALRARVSPRQVGVFAVLTRSDARRVGARDLAALAALWPPYRCDVDGLGLSGVLPLGEPSAARALLPALAVGEDAAAAWGVLTAPPGTRS
ncbi:MAG: DUF455 family protein [Alphaproteobacteria bacterium]|nr:DUF455 family protein [Alphaproteobacteria bacterium]